MCHPFVIAKFYGISTACDWICFPFAFSLPKTFHILVSNNIHNHKKNWFIRLMQQLQLARAISRNWFSYEISTLAYEYWPSILLPYARWKIIENFNPFIKSKFWPHILVAFPTIAFDMWINRPKESKWLIENKNSSNEYFNFSRIWRNLYLRYIE